MESRARFALRRLRTALRPNVSVREPGAMTIEWNLPVAVRDGTTLRVNVFRPTHGEPAPALMSAHPYGKDAIPLKTRSRRAVNFQFRLFPQPGPIAVSNVTGWEAPDPDVWVRHGYAVVNCDLRGAGTSEGTAELLSAQEAEDYHDLIEWAAAQPWCTGRVGLDGVSYLAISQYRVAATRPPHLAAICPWEGLSDVYRDFARPGGVREDGFSIVWSKGTRRSARVQGDVRKEFVRRTERDDWYAAHTPELGSIEVPTLQCASFSDHSLHSRGCFEAFRRSGATRKWLYTHRDGKWSDYYGEAATETRRAFFDHVLKGLENGWAERPPVEIRVYESGSEPVAVLEADQWPPEDLDWTTLHIDAAAGLLSPAPPLTPATNTFSTRGKHLSWTWTVPHDLDVIGPMALELPVSLDGATDANLFVAVRKFRGGRETYFEGSYGYSLDAVTRGWQRVAHRALDEQLSTPAQPVHRHEVPEPLGHGEVAPIRIALLPHATRFRAGDELRVELGGRWIHPRDPLRGQFPAWYQRGPRARCTIHTGPDRMATLLLGIRALEQP